MSLRRLAALLLATAAPLAVALPAPAQQATPPKALARELGEEPFLLEADRLFYAVERREVVAEGNVRLESRGRMLTADRLVYRAREDLVVAEGHVRLLLPEGAVFHGERLEVTGDLRRGFVEGVMARLDTRGRLAAAAGARVEDRWTILENATFTTCRECGAGARPPWQLRARRVVHDATTRTLTYENVVFELGGVPVFWLPWFEHPDPSVERRTGLLAPEGGSDTELGLWLRWPFYVDLAPNRDLTLTPMVGTSQGGMLRLELRDLERFGRTELGGSIAWAKEAVSEPGRPRRHVPRGHLEGRGRYAPSAEDRAGFDLFWSSDDTYLDTFKISDEDVLENRLWFERYHGRHLVGAEAIAFQGLRPGDDQDTIPFVLPALFADLRWPDLPLGFGFALDVDARALHRVRGLDTRRLVAGGTLRREALGPLGTVWTLDAGLRGDLYWTDGDVRSFGPGPSDTAARLVPSLHLVGSWPLVTEGDGWQHLVEPVLAAGWTGAATRGRIPDEDSQSLEFDETNLFEPSRYPGLDRVEKGGRLAYGVRVESRGPGGMRVSGVLGQLVRFGPSGAFPAGSGLEGRFSDIVGRIDLHPADWLDLSYRFRVDPADGAFRRSDLAASLGPDRLRLRLNYVELTAEPGVALRRREEQVLGALRAALSDRVAVGGQVRYDFVADDLVSWSAGLVWRSDCLFLTVGVERRFTSRGELKDETSVRLRIGLAGLGGDVEAGGSLF